MKKPDDNPRAPSAATLPDREEAPRAAPPAGMPPDPEPVVRRGARVPGHISVGDVLWFPLRMVQRLFFPRLLDRYIQGELLSPLVFGWSLFIVLFVFAINLFKLAQLAARGARPEVVAEMLGLRVILSSVICLPMAMLLACLMAFGRLSGDSELIATQAGGIPNLRVVWNAFLLGLALSIAGVAMNEYVIPPAGKRLQHVEDQIKLELRGRIAEELTDQKAFIIQDFEAGKLSRLVAAKKFEPANPPYPALLRDVTYIQYEKGIVQTVVQAKRAEWMEPKPGQAGQQRWDFIDANIQFLAAVTKGKRWIWDTPHADLVLNKTPQQISRDQKNADQLTYRELELRIREFKRNRARKKVVREMEVELERKLAVPFAAVVLALIGAPLGIRRQRSTAGVGIGVSLLIIILYYIGMSFLGVLGESGRIGPMEAAWGCNVVALFVGLYLTWRSSR